MNIETEQHILVSLFNILLPQDIKKLSEFNDLIIRFNHNIFSFCKIDKLPNINIHDMSGDLKISTKLSENLQNELLNIDKYFYIVYKDIICTSLFQLMNILDITEDEYNVQLVYTEDKNKKFYFDIDQYLFFSHNEFVYDNFWIFKYYRRKYNIKFAKIKFDMIRYYPLVMIPSWFDTFVDDDTHY